MENALLVGLSRQMTLERQMDVVANNLANVNTAGFKGEKSLFEEYLSPGAREDNFRGRDRRVSFVQDRATLHDMSSGAVEQTKNPLDVAIKGNAFFAVQTAGGERYTRDGGMQINSQGQLVNVAGAQVLGANGPIVFQQTDHDINISPDGTVTVLEGTNRVDSVRGKLRMVSFPQAQQLLKDGSNLFAAPAGVTPQASTTATVNQGFIERSNVNSVNEMTRMIDVSRAYTNISAMLNAQADLQRSAITKLADVPA
jgi:flagellar basal-body rod protein FlgF/flagellar basal-body rod protein FlgG